MPRSLGVQLYRSYRRLCRRTFTLLVRGSFRSFGSGSTLEPPVRLLGVEHISIGHDVYMGPNSWLTYLQPEECSEGPADHGIFIGSGVTMAGDSVISAALRIVLEDHVKIGRYVHISDHAHRADDPTRPIAHQGITTPAPVRIGAGAWLGQGVIICPGVTIGRHAVVGANSVVRCDVPDGCLAAGAPAVVKRRRVPA